MTPSREAASPEAAVRMKRRRSRLMGRSKGVNIDHRLRKVVRIFLWNVVTDAVPHAMRILAGEFVGIRLSGGSRTVEIAGDCNRRHGDIRSEERRVGKECRSRWS